MRVFVSEFLVGGASSRSAVSASMRREGLAMLRAVTEDIARLPNFSVVTTLEAGTPFSPEIEVIFVNNETEEAAEFQKLLLNVDAVLIIAPESGGVLSQRCSHVRAAGVATWNCAEPAIELCGGKWRLAQHLEAHGLATIPTSIADLSTPPLDEFAPLVLKPRDGAGSQLTFLVTCHDDWTRAAQLFHEAGKSNHCLIQPFVVGKPLSVGVNCRVDGKKIECLPVAEQLLSEDGRFQYLGGRVPADLPINVRHQIEDVVYATCRTIDGLAGYIGIDLLLTPGNDVVIVEINPRLTTSYIGYRQLFSESLPERWVTFTDSGAPIRRNSRPVEFWIER